MLRALVSARHPYFALQVEEHVAPLYCWSEAPAADIIFVTACWRTRMLLMKATGKEHLSKTMRPGSEDQSDRSLRDLVFPGAV